ncbi:MAG: oxidoreductase [Lautropia sp.]
MSSDAPVWLITGCSSGLGRALAVAVLRRGQRCAVTARDPAALASLGDAHPDTCLPLALDVCDDRSVVAAVAAVERRFGRIDVLVNNAGYGYFAAVEEGDDDEVRAMFETNFFGVVRLTRRVLPGMRQRGSGHVVNISSIAGLLANPGGGYYAASKHAIEGLSEALAKEVREHGVRVTLIEPGSFRTDFHGRSVRFARQPLSAYAGTAAARRAQLKAVLGRQPGDPERAAQAIIRLVESDAPPLRVVFGKAAHGLARDKAEASLAALERWRDVAEGVDFPAAAS